MKNIEELKNLISEAVEDNITNKKIIKALRKEFIAKRLPEIAAVQLFSQTIDEYNLNINLLITIARVFKNELQDDRFNVKKFFSEQELFSYANNFAVEENQDYLLLKDVKQIDEKNYLGTITGKMATMMRKNCLYAYYKELQRSPKIITTSSGRQIKKIDANVKNIKDMEQEFLAGTMTPTAIHFAVLGNKTEGLVENFSFKKLYNNIGDMLIKPDFNFESPTYLPLISVDGWHRLTALCNAMERAELENIKINPELGCFIHVFDKEAEARKFIADTFKRCTTDLDYLKALEPTEENKFIEMFIDKSKWLKNRVAKTRQEMRADKNIVQYKQILTAFKMTDAKFDAGIAGSLYAKKIAAVIDDLLDFIYEGEFDDNFESMKESIFLNKQNIFEIYIKFATLVYQNDYSEQVLKLVEYIKNHEQQINNLLIQNKITQEILEKIFNEVI